MEGALLKIFLTFALLFILMGSLAAQPVNAVIVNADESTSVVLDKGDDLTVNLTGNPTTGYLWEVFSLDGSVLQQVGDSVFRQDQPLMGAGGTVSFQFKAVGSGSTTVVFAYHRPFEKGIPPIKTRELQVVVN